MTLSAAYLLHSRIQASPGLKLRVATQISRRDREGVQGHATFVSLTDDEVMELTSFENLEQLSSVLVARIEMERGVSAWLATEWRHEILGYVEDVVPGPGAISNSPMVEMRHIEVPPPVYSEYRMWRQQSIFNAVKGRPEIDDFRAYQSVLSVEPGVTFVVGFSGDSESYSEIYKTPEYQEFFRESSSRYMAQGIASLKRKIYARPYVVERCCVPSSTKGEKQSESEYAGT